MGTVRVAQVFPGSVAEIETAWYDTSRWSSWIDGLDEVVSVEGEWPREGASVTWVSGPAGRGTVTERVTAYEELAGQTLQVQDEEIQGRQSVSFTAVADGVEVQLALAYQLRRGSIIASLTDLLFIKRAMASSLDRTLHRFGSGLSARPAPPPQLQNKANGDD